MESRKSNGMLDIKIRRSHLCTFCTKDTHTHTHGYGKVNGWQCVNAAHTTNICNEGKKSNVKRANLWPGQEEVIHCKMTPTSERDRKSK